MSTAALSVVITMEVAQMATDRYVDKQNVTHLYSGMSSASERKEILARARHG